MIDSCYAERVCYGVQFERPSLVECPPTYMNIGLTHRLNSRLTLTGVSSSPRMAGVSSGPANTVQPSAPQATGGFQLTDIRSESGNVTTPSAPTCDDPPSYEDVMRHQPKGKDLLEL